MAKKPGSTRRRKLTKESIRKMSEGGERGGRINSTPETEIMYTNPNMVLSKKDAIALGFKVYRTGKRCKHGHRGWRRTYTPGCIDCVRENARRDTGIQRGWVK